MHTPYHLIQPSLPRQRGRGPRPAAVLPQPQKKIKKQDDSLFGLYSSHGEKGFSWEHEVPSAAASPARVWGFGPWGCGTGSTRCRGQRHTGANLQGSCTPTLLCSPQHPAHSWQGDHQHCSPVRDAVRQRLGAPREH